MDISFQTLVYTDIASVAEWNEQHNIKPKPTIQRKRHTPSKITNYPEYQTVKVM